MIETEERGEEFKLRLVENSKTGTIVSGFLMLPVAL